MRDLVKFVRNEGETKLSSSTNYNTLIYMSSERYPKKKLERDPYSALTGLRLKLGRTYTQHKANATTILESG